MKSSGSSTLPKRTKYLLPLLTFTVFLNMAMGLPSRTLPKDLRGTAFACNEDIDCQSPMYCNLNNPKAPFCDCGVFHTWSVEHHRCVGLVNTSCALRRICAKHSICNDDEWCQCDEKHTATKSRRCLLSYDSVCDPFDSSDICNHELLLVCNFVTKRCDCKYGEQMKYDQSVNECRMLVGEPCDPLDASYYRSHNLLHHKCVKGGVCWQNTQRDKVGQCYCEGYRVQDPITKDCVAPRNEPIIVDDEPIELEIPTHAIQHELVSVTDHQMNSLPEQTQRDLELEKTDEVSTDLSVIPEGRHPTTDDPAQKAPTHSLDDDEDVLMSSSASLCPIFTLIYITLVIITIAIRSR